MSIYSNVTEQDLIKLRKLAEQQKEQRALKIKNRILKQTHDIKLAETLSPITKKLDEVNQATKNLREVTKESNSENNQEIISVEIDSEDENIQTNIKTPPNSSIFSELMTKTIGSLMSSSNSLRIKPSPSDATILGVPITTLGGDKLRIRDTDHKLTPETYKALSYTGYTGKTMKNENDILMMNNITNDLGYTGVRDKPSNRKTFFTKTLPKIVDKNQNKTFDEFTDDSDSLQGEGVKIIIPSNIIDIYTRLEVLLGLKLRGHTDTLTEASNLIDELYKRGEIQNEQQYRNALNNFLPNKWSFQVNYQNKSHLILEVELKSIC